ncbi:MAG TPA: flagellar basal body rod protein FlgB [Burkholderiaceae bacterium]|nr:flagellar basal body rod protein FlgB [Burkholderiaceae bacterium]
MLDRLTSSLDFNATALLLRSERTRVLASNIANADTPHYKARDFNFQSALAQATGVQMNPSAGGAQPTAAALPAMATTSLSAARTHTAHQEAAGGQPGAPTLLYRTHVQGALDANSVDLDTERAAFADNSVRYEASLRFINGQIRTLMTAINGQG